MINCLEEIRVILNVHYSRLTTAHKSAADSFFIDIRGKILNVAERKGIEVKIPITIHEELTFSFDNPQPHSLIDLASTVIIHKELTMTQTPIEFLSIASKLIPEFDGRHEGLQSFIAALTLVNSVCINNDIIAVNLAKTRLKGTAINLLNGNETNLNQIIDSLRKNVKGDSTEVITAKLMNAKQASKNANIYIKEIEDLTKSLQSAYIADGLTPALAEQYSTKAAVKAITTNATNEKVKLIMQAGQFNTLNEAVAKFINCCTDTYGQHNDVLYYNDKQKSLK